MIGRIHQKRSQNEVPSFYIETLFPLQLTHEPDGIWLVKCKIDEVFTFEAEASVQMENFHIYLSANQLLSLAKNTGDYLRVDILMAQLKKKPEIEEDLLSPENIRNFTSA